MGPIPGVRPFWRDKSGKAVLYCGDSANHRCGASPFLSHWEPCLVYGRLWEKDGSPPGWFLPDIWKHGSAMEFNGHPCPKPVSLMFQIIEASKARSVLDPFAGSGTTMVAARKLGVRSVGIEVGEKFCRLIRDRWVRPTVGISRKANMRYLELFENKRFE
jgi:hypothetical protein